MHYTNRFGDSFIGMHTEFKRGNDMRCIYCGEAAKTREHVPSKVFLAKGYSGMLATVPACEVCNNSFSLDEEYVSRFIQIYKDCLYLNDNPEYSRDEPLSIMILNEIKSVWNIHINLSQPENQRIKRILRKLAIGHIGYDFDLICFGSNIDIDYRFKPFLNGSEITDFYKCPELEVFPSIGSRASFSYIDLSSSESLHLIWKTVKKGRYEYIVYNDKVANRIIVKIVICDFLYCIASL